MPITVERYQDQPIIIATITEPIDGDRDFLDMFARILGIRDTIQGYPKYYTIIDMTRFAPSFSEFFFALVEARKASQKRRPEFPNEIHLVGSGELFRLASNALGQVQYGGYTAPLHANIDEALNAVRANQAK